MGVLTSAGVPAIPPLIAAATIIATNAAPSIITTSARLLQCTIAAGMGGTELQQFWRP